MVPAVFNIILLWAPVLGVGRERQLDSTPGRSHKLNPNAIHAVKQGEVPEALIEFCKDALGNKVLALQELSDKLMHYKANAPQDDLLKCVIGSCLKAFSITVSVSC